MRWESTKVMFSLIYHPCSLLHSETARDPHFLVGVWEGEVLLLMHSVILQVNFTVDQDSASYLSLKSPLR